MAIPSPAEGAPPVLLDRGWESAETRHADAGGVSIAYRRFTAAAEATQRLVLLHGGRAHSGWWRWVIGELPSGYDVVVPDLSGHGLSGRRPDYTPDAWAAEIEGLADAVGWREFAVVGHSMGGKVGISVARRGRVSTLILVDTPFSAPGEFDPFQTPPVRTKRVYDTYEETVSRFRLTPDQPTDDQERLRLIAADAVCREGGGWTWRFDPSAYRVFDDAEVLPWLGGLPCPVAYVRAGRSGLTNERTERLVARYANRMRAITLPGAYHHAPIDSPVATAEAMVRLIEGD